MKVALMRLTFIVASVFLHSLVGQYAADDNTELTDYDSSEVTASKRLTVHNYPSVPHSVCRTESAWAKLETALDIYNNPVIVLPTFRQDDSLVEQVFFERYCAGHANMTLTDSQRLSGAVQMCHGVDEKRYSGECVTRMGYSYARVKNMRGEIGWNAIQIRSGCECALMSKAENLAESVLRRRVKFH